MAFSVNVTNAIFNSMTPIASYPFSLMGWFRVPDVNIEFPILGLLSFSGLAQFEVSFAGNTTQAAVAKATGGGFSAAVSSGPMVPGTWHHLVAVYASDTLRTIYLDGSNTEVNTDNIPMASLDFFYLGNIGSSTPVDLAEVSIVQAEVSAEQATILASGYPMLSTPLARQAVIYHDCIRQLNRPGLGPISSSAVTPPAVDHPRIFSSTGGVSAVMPARFSGPWQTDETEFYPLSTGIGQLAVAGAASNNSILSGEVIS